MITSYMDDDLRGIIMHNNIVVVVSAAAATYREWIDILVWSELNVRSLR